MIEIKHELSLKQQLELTPQLIQALRLLQLTRLELEQELKTELEINPFLEEELSEQEILESEFRSTMYDGAVTVKHSKSAEKREEDPIENTAHKDIELHDYLLWQLGLSLDSEQGIQIGEAIIGNINDDGYLSASVEDIAEFTGADVEDVEKILRKIQNFDPSGVGARNLKECLLIQIKYLGINDPIINGILTDHLSDLEKKDYSSIAKAMSVNTDLIMTAIDTISHLNPKPGGVYSAGDIHYIMPDVKVTKRDDKPVVELIEEGLPRLRASDYYAKKLLLESGYNEDAKKFIREKLQGARWLIKAVEQRKNTIKKVVNAIVERQKDFFKYGDKYLEPMVLKDIAGDVGVHETTVGRVTNGKYVQTQWGIYELKYFFSPSLKTDNGELLSTKLVKQKIKELIDKENSSKPLSDTDIRRVLKADGINIARRTITKYRGIMKIPPVHMRRVKMS